MDIEKLEKLNELKEKGVLTQEEFEKQKWTRFIFVGIFCWMYKQ